jgi:hypothetical protein
MQLPISRTRKTLLSLVWFAAESIGRFLYKPYLRSQQRKQAKLLSATVQSAIKQPSTAIATFQPTTELKPIEQEMLKVAEVAAEQMPILLPAAAPPVIGAIPEPTVAVEPEAITVAELESVGVEPIAVGQPELSCETTETQDTTAQPESQISRSELVLALLDEAWGLGHTTYPKLISYVKEQTGTGCSRRTIASWKEKRGLA